MQTIMYHHRGPIEELIRLDDWWRKASLPIKLYLKIDLDDEHTPHITDHFRSGAFPREWILMIGHRTDDASYLADELLHWVGIDAARGLIQVTSDPYMVGVTLLQQSMNK